MDLEVVIVLPGQMLYTEKVRSIMEAMDVMIHFRHMKAVCRVWCDGQPVRFWRSNGMFVEWSR